MHTNFFLGCIASMTMFNWKATVDKSGRYLASWVHVLFLV